MDTSLAVMAIVVENPDSVTELNELLHNFSDYIIGRMGIPHQKRNCSLISVAIDAPADVINNLSGKIGKINGVTSKVAYSKV